MVFTTYSGVDPHRLLVERAALQNMSVYFGIPALPRTRPGRGDVRLDLLPAYYQFYRRILEDHRRRYSMPMSTKFRKHAKPTLYDTIKGYYSTDEVCLAGVSSPMKRKSSSTSYKDIYMELGKLTHQVKKQFVISPYILLNKFLLVDNFTLQQHVDGFGSLAETGTIDVIAVQEGRGRAKGAYFWPPQANTSIATVDPVLDEIVHYLSPRARKDVTYQDTFIASNQEVGLYGTFANPIKYGHHHPFVKFLYEFKKQID